MYYLIKCLLWIGLIFITQNLYAVGPYLGLKYTSVSMEQTGVTNKEYDVSGAGVGIDLGYKFVQWFGLELGHSQISFDKNTEELGVLGTISNRTELTNLTLGVRFFLGRYVALKLGSVSSQYNFNYTGTGILGLTVDSIDADEMKGSATGTYYGLGLNLPLTTGFCIFADYESTVLSLDNPVNSDSSLAYASVTAGARFMF